MNGVQHCASHPHRRLNRWCIPTLSVSKVSLGPWKGHIWTVYNGKVVKTDQREVLLLEACIDLYGEQACYCYFILDKEASVVTQCSLREAP